MRQRVFVRGDGDGDGDGSEDGGRPGLPRSSAGRRAAGGGRIAASAMLAMAAMLEGTYRAHEWAGMAGGYPAD